MSVRWTAIVAVVLGLAGTECTTSSAGCERLCTNLQACGMLPGPLGQEQSERDALTDCESRCGISTNAEDLVSCFEGMQSFSSEDPDKWLSSGPCGQAATCLRATFDDDRVLGVGSARLRPDTQEGAGEGGPCQQVRFSEEGELVAAGDVILELVSDELPTITVADGECRVTLERPLHVSKVPVGLYAAQLKIYAKDSNECVLYTGNSAELLAESVQELTYPSDFTGSDFSGESPVLCPEAEPNRCRDGVDNDGDSLIDCEDSDCDDSGVCDDVTEEDEEGSTG